MTVREIIGLVCLIMGVIISPLGWIFSHKILLIAGLFFGVGGWLFYTERVIKKEEQLAKESSGSGNYGPYVPNDIHNYTGWRSGGRTNTFEDNSSDSSSD